MAAPKSITVGSYKSKFTRGHDPNLARELLGYTKFRIRDNGYHDDGSNINANVHSHFPLVLGGMADAKLNGMSGILRGVHRLSGSRVIVLDEGSATTYATEGNIFLEFNVSPELAITGGTYDADEDDLLLGFGDGSCLSNSDSESWTEVVTPEDSGKTRTSTEHHRLVAAASNGDARAQVDLGVIFFHGYGCRKDYREAARLFTLAADQGDVKGRINLGNLLACGLGVKRNDTRAIRLYQMAAKQGDPAAIGLLRSMHTRRESEGAVSER